MAGVCGDNRFEIIAKVKEHLIKATNIEMHPEELAQVDNILFRLWQCGYLKDTKELQEKCSPLLDKLYLSGLTPKQIALVEQLQDALGV